MAITSIGSEPCLPQLSCAAASQTITTVDFGVCYLNGIRTYTECPRPETGALASSITSIEQFTNPAGGKCSYCVGTTSPTAASGSSTASTVASTSPTTSTAASSPSSSPSPSPNTGVPTITPTTQNPSSTTNVASNGPTTSSSAGATPAPGKAKSGLPSGAAAGVGIGCAIAGALIAGLIVFLLLRRKRRPQYEPTAPYYVAGEKEAIDSGSPIRGGAITNVDRLLPQPAEDDAIIGQLSKIRDDIKNHVQNYYHNNHIQPELVDDTEVMDLAHAISTPPSTVRRLLLNPETRVPAIRLFLGHLILTSCIGQSESRVSFLPQEIASLAAFLTAAEGTRSAQPALFIKWKTITGALLQRQYGNQLGDNDPRIESVNRTVATADSVLRPFVDPSVDIHARRRNLDATVKRAAQFAFLLFSQSASYGFDYTGTGQLDSLVVFPALVQTISDEAEAISPPRVLREREVVAGLGS